MPNVRLTWVNNSTGHDGQIVRMGEPGGAKSDIADIGPNVEECIALNATEPEACFTVAAYDGGGEEESGEACVETGVVAPDVGEPWEGGVYVGLLEIGGVNYHIILGNQDSEVSTTQWKTSRTSTSGTGSQDDGLANTQAMITAGEADHPAASYCVGYSGGGHTDWYLPARNELAMAQPLADEGHPEFSMSLSTLRWSSSQASADHAWCRRLSDGNEWGSTSSAYKTNNYTVRPARRIPV